MSTHFEVKQRRAKRQTLWLVLAYVFSYVTVVYLAYSLVQALAYLASSDDVERPHWMFFYLLGSPFNADIPANLSALMNIAMVVALILGISWLVTIWNIRKGGGALAKSLGAERIVRRTSGKFDRRLLNVVEEIAIASGVRVPQVFVMRQEKSINCFSAGWRSDDAVICVTQGMIDQLSRDELQAVIAHEYSHILNGDTRLSMRLLGLLVGSHVLIFFSWGAVSMIFAGLIYPPIAMYVVMIANELSLDDPTAFYPAATLIFGLAAISLFNVTLSVFLKLAVSRRREYLADVHAVQWTRHPMALISALQKITECQMGSRIMHSRANSISHMTFASVFRGRSLSQFLDTHPLVKKRIRAIESRREFWPEEKKREPKPELTQDAVERAARDWSTGGQTRDIPLELATISDLLTAIPDAIRQMAVEPDSVTALVFALLLDRDETIRAKQFAAIETLNDAETSSRVHEIAAQTDPLAERLRPPLAEITFPTLRELSAEQYQSFRRMVNALVRADGKIDLFEYTFNALLVRDLDLHFRTAKEAHVLYFSTQAVLDPFTVVLSAVAYAGNRGDGKLLESYNEGMHVFGHRRPILNSKDCTFAALDAALQKLSEASPAVKRRIIRSLTACIMADHFVTVREREIIRAIAAMLGVPMPPLA